MNQVCSNIVVMENLHNNVSDNFNTNIIRECQSVSITTQAPLTTKSIETGIVKTCSRSNSTNRNRSTYCILNQIETFTQTNISLSMSLSYNSRVSCNKK